MSDIVERLRSAGNQPGIHDGSRYFFHEAADEIERLRGEYERGRWEAFKEIREMLDSPDAEDQSLLMFLIESLVRDGVNYCRDAEEGRDEQEQGS